MRAKTTPIAITCVFAWASASGQNTAVVSAWNYYRYDELDKAQQAIDQAINNPKTSTKAKTWYYRGLIYLKIATSEKFKNLAANPLDTAYQAFLKAWELEGGQEYHEEIPQQIEIITNLWYNEGVQRYSQGDYRGAYGYFERATQAARWLKEKGLKNTVDTALEVAAMQSAYFADLPKQALTHWQYLEKNGVYDRQAVLIAGDIYLRLNRPQEVHRLVDRAMKALPEARTDLIKLKINAYLLEENLQAVDTLLDEALAADPQNAYLWIIKGDVLLQQNDISGAEQAYVRAAQVAPDNFDAQYAAGAFYYNQAVEIQDSINNLPLDAHKEYEKLMGERNQMLKKALPYLEKAFSLNPNDQNTIRALMATHMFLGDKEKADQLKKLLEGQN